MKRVFFFMIMSLIMSFNANAQSDSTHRINLLSELTSDAQEEIELLPQKFLINQRLLWGKKGLMRSLDRFELTPTNRQKELDIRRFMLVSHQVVGFATLGGMVAQGIVGAGLYNGKNNLKGAHEALAAAVNIGYFTTASLSLFAPPKMLNERKGYSSIKVHKALALIHLTAMITTNILASQLGSNPSLRPYHRAAAFTAFGAFAASMIVIKF